MPASLGILYHEYRRHGEPFGLETLHFRQLCEMGQVRGMRVFVFLPQGVERQTRQVHGYIPGVDGRWTEWRLSTPDVVYLRGVTMDAVSEQQMMDATAWLQSQGATLLNSPELMEALGDKWLTYRLLVEHPMIQDHLPQTALLSAGGLSEMLDLHSLVMIKHRRGFESRGMIRVESLPEGGYSCVVNDLDARRQHLTFSSRDALLGVLSNSAQPANDFIIQQGIRLASLQGRTFELRMIFNKAGERWLRTGMVIRLSGSADMPFLAVGNERNQPPSEILPKVFGDHSLVVLAQARNLARIITAELERAAGPGGELALDFGFDDQGQPWLIEGNSKPFNLFIRTGAYSLRRKNMARVLEYAHYLAAAKEPEKAGVLT